MPDLRLQEVVLRYAEEPTAQPVPLAPVSPVQQAPSAQPAEEKRDRYTTYQFPSLVKEVKRHALDTDVPDYAVVEAALREYLERHRK